MVSAPQSERLLKRARFRLHVARLLENLCRSLLLAACAAVVVVLLHKLTGLWAQRATFVLLGLIPAAFAAAALTLTRRPDLVQAARIVDRTNATHDLFLNLVTLEDSVGAYQPLVVDMAERMAPNIDVRRTVPVMLPAQFWRAVTLMAVALGITCIPLQLDPFGNVAQASVEKKHMEELQRSRRDTQLRARELQKKLVEKDGELSPEVKRTVEDLKRALRQAKPQQRQKNDVVLNQQQRRIGEQWRELMRKQAAAFMRKNEPAQQFGGSESDKLRKLVKQLQNGDPSGLKQELDDIKQQLERLAKTGDPVQRTEELQRLRKRLKQLERLASRTLQSKPLSAALQRALQQLDAARLEKLADLAKSAASESLELAKLELEELAQTARDLKKLEEALKTLAEARKCNAKGNLDGGQCENCITLADYAELYRMLLAERDGKGLGEPNGGGGAKAPEDDSVASDFKNEFEKTAIRAGKILLSLKTQGLSDPGAARQMYREQLQKVKQSASEAVELEDIPPGYRERVKRYFDSLDESTLGALKPSSDTPPAAAPANER